MRNAETEVTKTEFWPSQVCQPGVTEQASPKYLSQRRLFWKDRNKKNHPRQTKELAGVLLFENTDKITFSQLERIYFKPKGRESTEWWAKLKSGDSMTLSFRKNKVDLYYYSPPRDRRSKKNPPKIQNYIRHTDFLKHFIRFKPPDLNGGWTVEGSIYTEKESLAIILPMIERIVSEQNLRRKIPQSVTGIDQLVLSLVYPIIGELAYTGIQIGPQSTPPPNVSAAFRRPDLRSACEIIFGKYCTPKVIRLTGESISYSGCIRFDNLALALLAKGILPLDYLQEILSWRLPVDLDPAEYIPAAPFRDSDLPYGRTSREIREFLKTLKPRKSLEFLHTIHEEGPPAMHLLLDTTRMLQINGNRLTMPNRIRSLRSLHDDLALQERRLRNPDFQIELGELTHFEGAKVRDMTIHFPTSNYEVVQWGNELHNCIGGYAKEMRNGNCILLALQRNGSPLYHVMIHPYGKYVEQFYGDKNRSPFPPDREAFDDWLTPDNPLWNAAQKYSREAKKVRPSGGPTT